MTNHEEAPPPSEEMIAGEHISQTAANGTNEEEHQGAIVRRLLLSTHLAIPITCLLAAVAVACVVAIIVIETGKQRLMPQPQNTLNLTEIKISQLKKRLVELDQEHAELERDLIGNNITRSQWAIDTYCNSTNSLRERVCKPCLNDWTHRNGLCYQVVSTATRVHDEASQYCQEMGSTLAILHDVEKEWPFICSSSTQTPSSDGYWIGLKFDGQDWRWANGTTLDPATAKWREAPTARTKCVIALSGSCVDGWNPYPCTLPQKWICQKNAFISK